MKTYLDIVKNVLDRGEWKENRTGTRTLALANQHFSHDMSEGYPLLTTKKMAFRSMCVELEGFIKGITSKKWFEDRKCYFWRYWSNPQKVDWTLNHYRGPQIDRDELRKKIQITEDDLGPLGYSYEWRRFGEVYDENDDGVLKGFDQFKYIVDTLKNNPNDRRMVCSAWNPNHLSRTALPACHLLWIVTVVGDRLNLHWTQRSCDLPVGVPVNIASYALLMLLLCEESGLKPGNLSGMLCDCHIYENQIDAAMEQVKRIPGKLPALNIPWNSYTDHGSWGEQSFDIFTWDHTRVDLLNYNPQPKIDFGQVAV